MRIPQWLFAVGALAATDLAASPSQAQNGVDFYNGKTITYIVATSPGGGYDLYGRLICEYMQRYLPGSTFVVKNLPGAGHLIGTNAIYASKADGLTIGTFNTGLIYNQLIGHDAAKFDLTKMSWIGKAGTEPRVMLIAEQSPIKSWAELVAQKEPVTFATSGIGASNYVELHMLYKVLKLPIKILTGYNGNDDQMAMRRSEVVGGMGSRSSFEEFRKNGYARYIAQIGGNDKDVPQLLSLVKEPAAQQFIRLVQAQGDIARLTAGPPGIPQDRLDALRGAYRKAMEDKELQARALKLERPIEPLYGDDVLKSIKAALDQTPEIKALLKEAIEVPADKGGDKPAK